MQTPESTESAGPSDESDATSKKDVAEGESANSGHLSSTATSTQDEATAVNIDHKLSVGPKMDEAAVSLEGENDNDGPDPPSQSSHL